MSRPASNPISRKAALCLTLALCTLLPGCLRRRLMVRSNPPGAMVYVDNQPVGTTPCATDFVYYGTREIRLVKPGFETLTVNQPIPVPWYEVPPFDFVTENVVPRKIQDYRTVSYNMVPQVIVPTEQLLSRAEGLRRSTLQGAVLPATATSMPGITTPLLPAEPTPEPIFPGPELVPTPAAALPPGGQPLQALPEPVR
jgi:hypothetical protein